MNTNDFNIIRCKDLSETNYDERKNKESRILVNAELYDPLDGFPLGQDILDKNEPKTTAIYFDSIKSKYLYGGNKHVYINDSEENIIIDINDGTTILKFYESPLYQHSISYSVDKWKKFTFMHFNPDISTMRLQKNGAENDRQFKDIELLL